jgi:ferritin
MIPDFILRDKLQDLDDIREERKRYEEKIEALHDEEQAVLRDIADIRKYMRQSADIEREDEN